MIIPSKAYRAYEKDCIKQLQAYKGERLKEQVEVTALYFMPDKRSRPDLVNLEESTADILELAGIVENDRDIVSWDGSRIAGIDKENPRVEISIKVVKP